MKKPDLVKTIKDKAKAKLTKPKATGLDAKLYQQRLTKEAAIKKLLGR
jgi:hypothetical protein